MYSHRNIQIEIKKFEELTDNDIQILNKIYETAKYKESYNSFSTFGYIYNQIPFEKLSEFKRKGRVFILSNENNKIGYAICFDNIEGQWEEITVNEYFEHEIWFLKELNQFAFAYIDQIVIKREYRQQKYGTYLLEQIESFYINNQINIIGAIIHWKNYFAILWFASKGYLFSDFYEYTFDKHPIHRTKTELWIRIVKILSPIYNEAKNIKYLDLVFKIITSESYRCLPKEIKSKLRWCGWIFYDPIIQNFYSIPISNFTFYSSYIKYLINVSKNLNDLRNLEKDISIFEQAFKSVISFYSLREKKQAESIIPYLINSNSVAIIYSLRECFKKEDIFGEFFEKLKNCFSSFRFKIVEIEIDSINEDILNNNYSISEITTSDKWKPWIKMYRDLKEADSKIDYDLWLHIICPFYNSPFNKIGCFITYSLLKEDIVNADLTIDNIILLIFAISSNFAYVSSILKTKLTINHALCSAIASVMARNVDHLLGSHIETAIAHQMPDLRSEIYKIASEKKFMRYNVSEECFSDDFWLVPDYHNEPNYITRMNIDKFIQEIEKQYSNYRLKRMDLVARFSTEWISWSVGMSFFHHVMFPFMRNGILLHFLGRGEGISLSDLDFQVFYPQHNCQYCTNHCCSSHRVRLLRQQQGASQEASSEEVPFYTLPLTINRDFQVAPLVPVYDFMSIRGGDIGAHAFHIFLENVLRNSAKHGQLDSSPKIRLKVWAIAEKAKETLENLGFCPARENFWETAQKDSDDYWFVVVSSSADKEASSEYIDELLCKPFINEIGEIDQEAWGMKEKKICAAYLAGGTPEDANSSNPDYLWAGTIQWEDSKPRLAYCIKIPKARFLLFISKEEDGL